MNNGITLQRKYGGLAETKAKAAIVVTCANLMVEEPLQDSWSDAGPHYRKAVA